MRFTILHPDTGWVSWRDDLNEDSLVLLVEYGMFEALFTGDAGFVAESVLAGRVGAVDLLKAGHHGSPHGDRRRLAGPSSSPRAAIVSVGHGEPLRSSDAGSAAAAAAAPRIDLADRP